MEQSNLDSMSPYERTLNVITGLDEMLSQADVIVKSGLSANDLDPALVDKISNTLRWLTGNLDTNKIIQILDDESNHFTNSEVIKDLLNERYFNVKMCC